MKQDTSTHLQDSGHKEGNVGNTPPKGQPREGSNPQSMSNMQQEEEKVGNKEKEKEQDTLGNP
jgi:hypothetical protein